MLTTGKAPRTLVMYSFRHSREPEWLQAHCSNAFSREASVRSVVYHCNCDQMSNISAPRRDPWSDHSRSTAPPPPRTFHSLMILVEGQDQMNYSEGQISVSSHRVYLAAQQLLLKQTMRLLVEGCRFIVTL